MIKEHETVVLLAAVPAEGLLPGDVGTVVHVYRDGQAYEVEFITLEGKTAAVITFRSFTGPPCRATRMLTLVSLLNDSSPQPPCYHSCKNFAGPCGRINGSSPATG